MHNLIVSGGVVGGRLEWVLRAAGLVGVGVMGTVWVAMVLVAVVLVAMVLVAMVLVAMVSVVSLSYCRRNWTVDLHSSSKPYPGSSHNSR